MVTFGNETNRDCRRCCYSHYKDMGDGEMNYYCKKEKQYVDDIRVKAEKKPCGLSSGKYYTANIKESEGA